MWGVIIVGHRMRNAFDVDEYCIRCRVNEDRSTMDNHPAKDLSTMYYYQNEGGGIIADDLKEHDATLDDDVEEHLGTMDYDLKEHLGSAARRRVNGSETLPSRPHPGPGQVKDSASCLGA